MSHWFTAGSRRLTQGAQEGRPAEFPYKRLKKPGHRVLIKALRRPAQCVQFTTLRMFDPRLATPFPPSAQEGRPSASHSKHPGRPAHGVPLTKGFGRPAHGVPLTKGSGRPALGVRLMAPRKAAHGVPLKRSGRPAHGVPLKGLKKAGLRRPTQRS
jgi:hypothetical protein